ncbi:MAG: hypothetical protein U9R08_07085 [Nanoarchaeota archaeon]|nr:hypothetical protein [Nanoarchaeota archaeon]
MGRNRLLKKGYVDNSSRSISFEKLLDSISNNNPEELLEIIVNHLMFKHKMSKEEIIAIISKKGNFDTVLIPIDIFAAKLSPAEALVKYLKEEFELGYNEIASLINRDDRGIWGTYKRAQSKMNKRFNVREAKFFIPVQVFKERKYSILENLTKYLVEKYNLTTYKISKLLNKKPGTLWAVYRRVKNKK